MHESLTDRVKTFTHRLGNKKGHRFLYSDFDRLVDDLRQAGPLLEETIDAIRECVIALIWEADVYQGYQLWAIRCNQCASIFEEFLPNKEGFTSDIERQQDTFADRFIWSFVLFPTFDEYCDRITVKPERVRRVATLCFENSDSGRRPHISKDEEVFYVLFKRGYALAEEYINSTDNYEAFPEWFRVLDPLHIEGILEGIEDCGWNDEYIYGMLEDTLVKQLILLKKWLDGDALSFIDYWKSTGIIKLLELVDDDIFFATLRILSKVKFNQEVRAVIQNYTNDDESRIQRFAKQLLEEYDK